MHRNKEIPAYRKSPRAMSVSNIDSSQLNTSIDPSVFHNPHKELVVITGQQEHKHHLQNQRMAPHPKQDHGMETGSMKPIALPTYNKHYVGEPEFLPSEESRKVQFSNRSSSINHYNAERPIPPSKLQNTGHSIIVQNQTPDLYKNIGEGIK